MRRWRGMLGRRRRVLRLCCSAVVLGVLVFGGNAVLTPTPTPVTDGAAPASVDDVLAAGAQEGIPAGCPGGPAGRPAPGTQCPDGTIPGLPPAGCPGGPAGRPVPGTECPDGSVPATPIAPTGCRFGPLGPPELGTECPDGSPPRDRSADPVLRNIFGFDDTEEHPLSAYDIGCDEGSWNAFLRKMWCGAQSLPFSLGKWAIGIGTELLDWALEFQVADVLTPIAGTLSRVYQGSLIGPLNVETLAWTLTLLVGGWSIMRARTANGLREIFATFIIAIFGGILLANPEGYLNGSVELAQNTSGAVLEATDGALGGQRQDSDAIRDRLGGVLQRSFVAEPYDLINWGEPLSGSCAAARNEILEGGPWGSEDRPREIMREAGCEEQAEYNANPTDERAAAALTVSVASVLIAVLMSLMALAVFAAQVTLVALFSVASVVWVVALFPGNRAVLWWWLSRLVWSVLITFASIFLLSWVSITVTAVLDATADLSIVQRCIIVIVITGVAYKFRSAIDRGVDSAAGGLAGSLSKTTNPSSEGKFVAIGAAAAGGAALAGPLSLRPRQVTQAALAAGGGAAAGARRGANIAVAGTRGVGAQAAQRSRAAGASTRAMVAAPLSLPQRFGRTRERATERSTRVRNRLDNARQTRQQWAANVRHPVSAARSGRTAAERDQHETFDWM